MKHTSDYQYLGQLLREAQQGSRSAFAELYASTYTQSYVYAYRYLGDAMCAKNALREIYGRAMCEIQELRTPELFMTWLNRICFRVCLEMKREMDGVDVIDVKEEMVAVGTRRYSISQVMRLPLTESQAIIQHYYLKLPMKENARNLDISLPFLKKNLRMGRSHLKKLLGDY